MSLILAAMAMLPTTSPAPRPPRVALPIIRVGPVQGNNSIRAAAPPAEFFTRAVPPVAAQPLPRLFHSFDYPQAAMLAREQGAATVLLTVTSEGRIGGCHVASSSGSANLDSATCRILGSRARFIAARDESGKAVPSAIRTKIRWALPPLPRVPAAAWRSEVRLTVDGMGAVLRCSEEHSPGGPTFLNNCRSPGLLRSAANLVRRENAAMLSLRAVASLTPGRNGVATMSEGKLLHRARAEFVLDAAGKVTDCRLLDVGGALPPPPGDRCKALIPGDFTGAIAGSVVTIEQALFRLP